VNSPARGRAIVEEIWMEVRVEGSLERAIRTLKKKLAAEGVFKEMKIRSFYEKPSVRRKRKRQEAERKRRKAMRRAQRHGS
jgi:small subunit ribosomal protein S21